MANAGLTLHNVTSIVVSNITTVERDGYLSVWLDIEIEDNKGNLHTVSMFADENKTDNLKITFEG